MNTIHWTMTLGLQEGYHTNQQSVLPLLQVGEIYQEIAEEIYKETKIYISANIQPAKTLYRQEWGCPKSGEDTVIFSGVCNPVFSHPRAYEEVLKRLAKKLKERFRQKTVMLEIMSANAIYLTDEDDEMM